MQRQPSLSETSLGSDPARASPPGGLGAGAAMMMYGFYRIYINSVVGAIFTCFEIGKLMKPVKSVEEARPRLGRGLAALLGGPEGNPQGAAQPPRGPKKIPVEFLRPNPRNP